MTAIRHRREVNTTNPPAIDDFLVGEIVVNTVTGKLYIIQAHFDEATNRVVKDNVIEFSGKVVCQTNTDTPDIIFDDVSDFCCFGDTLSVEVSGLQRSPTNYSFAVEELTANMSQIDVEVANYKNYTGSLDAAGDPLLYRSAIVPVNINVTKEDSAVSIFKFKILSENNLITEKVLSIKCKECGNN